MKSNLSKLATLLFCMVLSISLFAQEKKQKITPYLGDWSFVVSDAPYGYDKGTARIFMEENNLKGEFKLAGSTMKVNSFTEKNDGYSCTVYIDGYPIDVTLVYKNNKLSGQADDGNQTYNIALKKAN